MKEITEMNDQLGILQRKLAASKEQEEQLNNKLLELNREMNHFTYIVSHDLQAPLRMVTGFLELLEKKYGDKLDDTAKKYIDFTIKGASKMKSLIFDLLEYSRLNTVAREITQVDLNLVVEEVKEKLVISISETGAIFTPDHLPVVVASKTQMVHLFQNLFSNSIKYRSAAIPEIRVTVKKENNFWIIGVQDNGPGIEEAFYEKIFIVFRRLHNDDDKYTGTGIGLALCKKIIELHGGTIWVKSVVGKGSTFYFTLPCSQQE
jgi:light-regulated signal transduction histidine kinase (bacteriophytochrome)